MKPSAWILTLLAILLGSAAKPAAAAEGPKSQQSVGEKCVECHTKTTRNVVNDWKLSKHSGAGIGCEVCHGSDHTSASDAAKATVPTPETCGQCHSDRLEQFKKGKHALGWAAMEAMP